MSPEVSSSSSEKISKLLSNVHEIPSLPSVTTRILEVAENPSSSAQDLTEIIAHDPALTTQILKAANSAFYGYPNKIGTVYLAIVILGFNMIRTIALSAGVLKLFHSRTAKSSLLDPSIFWEHSLKCGVACRLLARHHHYFLAGEAFTAGILHDIGRVVLALYATDAYNEVIKDSRTRSCSLLESEATILGFSHAHAGGYLLKQWNLPISIVEAATHHHAPSQSIHAPELASLTSLANHLTHLLEFQTGGEKQRPTPPNDPWGVLKKAKDEDEEIQSLMPLFKSELKKASSFLEALRE